MKAAAMHFALPASTLSVDRLSERPVQVLPPTRLRNLQFDEYTPSNRAQKSLTQVFTDKTMPARRTLLKEVIRMALNPDARPSRSLTPSLELQAIAMSQDLRAQSPRERLGLAEALLGKNAAFCQMVRGHMQNPELQWNLSDMADLVARPQPGLSPLGFGTLSILGMNMMLAPLFCTVPLMKVMSPVLVKLGTILV